MRKVHFKLADYIKNGRPIPWEGMPVYTTYGWCKVSHMSDPILGIVVYRIESVAYGAHLPIAYGEFSNCTLPGEDNCPEIPDQIKQEIFKEAPFACGAELYKGSWAIVTNPARSISEIGRTVLDVPADLGHHLDLIFHRTPASKKAVADEWAAEDLKKANSDGRLTCAKCAGSLKSSQGVFSTFSWCPVCEE